MVQNLPQYQRPCMRDSTNQESTCDETQKIRVSAAAAINEYLFIYSKKNLRFQINSRQPSLLLGTRVIWKVRSLIDSHSRIKFPSPPAC